MAGQLTETEINIRKQTLESDLSTVKESLNKLDAERTNLVAQHHAISGAIQQCDLFLSDLKTVVSETTDSSIPSKKKG
jgi:flagellin-like hook-associated protein FlgL